MGPFDHMMFLWTVKFLYAIVIVFPISSKPGGGFCQGDNVELGYDKLFLSPLAMPNCLVLEW